MHRPKFMTLHRIGSVAWKGSPLHKSANNGFWRLKSFKIIKLANHCMYEPPRTKRHPRTQPTGMRRRAMPSVAGVAPVDGTYGRLGTSSSSKLVTSSRNFFRTAFGRVNLAPFSSKRLTTATCPPSAAKNSGDRSAAALVRIRSRSNQESDGIGSPVTRSSR
jgi:hypothetical protein